jgi:hypothetical protein
MQEFFPARSVVESLRISARVWRTWALVWIYFTTFSCRCSHFPWHGFSSTREKSLSYLGRNKHKAIRRRRRRLRQGCSPVHDRGGSTHVNTQPRDSAFASRGVAGAGRNIESVCVYPEKTSRPRINSGIVMQQNTDGDAPPVPIQPFHAHHVPNLFAVHGVIRTEIQCHNHVHA